MQREKVLGSANKSESEASQVRLPSDCFTYLTVLTCLRLASCRRVMDPTPSPGRDLSQDLDLIKIVENGRDLTKCIIGLEVLLAKLKKKEARHGMLAKILITTGLEPVF